MSVDWQQLSPLAFEAFSRELMGAHLNTQIEAFAPGPDGGVDLRAHDEQTIIQCKRYTSDKSKLFNKLIEEAEKNRVKKAKRYILITSLHLTPNDKDKIRKLVSAVQTTEDILGADDLDGLLAKYPHIRNLYPQLWLGDRAQLSELIENVVNRYIDEVSKDEFQRILETMTYVVPPPLSNDALKILKEHRALIITGKPGIGKTTLAQYLIWYITQTSQYEFVYVSSNIDTAFQKYNEDKNQIFLYDDFLGANLIKLGLEKNEDKRIPAFISKVKRAKNKLIIFTTREFIFRQASSMYENLREHEKEIKKIVLEIDSADLTFKAEILYNHLWKNRVPYNLIRTLFFDNTGIKWGEACYLSQILKDPSYNPRIIATSVAHALTSTNESTFAPFLHERVQHPHSLYDIVFQNQLSDLQRQILLVMGTFVRWATMEELDTATQAQCKEIYHSCQEYFESALKVLIGDFLTSSVSRYSNNRIIINFVNPGVRDFIIRIYYKQPAILSQLVQTLVYPEQLRHIIQIVNEHESASWCTMERLIKEKGIALIEQAVYSDSLTTEHIKLGASIIDYINDKDLSTYKSLIDIESNEGFSAVDSDTLDSYIKILNLFENDSQANIDRLKFINSAFENISDTTVFSIFDELESLKMLALNQENSFSSSEVWIENYYQYLADLSEISELEEEASIITSFDQAYPDGIAGIALDEFLTDIDNLIEEKEEEERKESEAYTDENDDWYSSPRTDLNDGSNNERASTYKDAPPPRYLSVFQTLDVT